MGTDSPFRSAITAQQLKSLTNVKALSQKNLRVPTLLELP